MTLRLELARSLDRHTGPSFQSREKKERSALSWYSDNSTCPFSLARPRENGQKEKGAPQNRPPTPSDPVLKGSHAFTVLHASAGGSIVSYPSHVDASPGG